LLAATAAAASSNASLSPCTKLSARLRAVSKLAMSRFSA
jgi:hypothetical protein